MLNNMFMSTSSTIKYITATTTTSTLILLLLLLLLLLHLSNIDTNTISSSSWGYVDSAISNSSICSNASIVSSIMSSVSTNDVSIG